MGDIGIREKRSRKKKEKGVVNWSSGSGSFDFSQIEPTKFRTAIEGLCQAGCLVMCMSSSDRNVRGIKVIHDDLEKMSTAWLNDESDFDLIIGAIWEALDVDDDGV